MNNLDYKRGSSRKRKYNFLEKLPLIIAGVVATGAIGGGVYYAGIKLNLMNETDSSTAVIVPTTNTEVATSSQITEAPTQEDALTVLLNQADLMAKGYDYDGAIALLHSDTAYEKEQQVLDAIAHYESVKTTLVQIKSSEITHVFFHTLIMDNSKAFDGDRDTPGYNQVMTTKNEFLKILQSMYDKGFVLVRLHDIAQEVIDENGTAKFVTGNIMLPEGKQAFVMSQDDVCYYEYMDGDGFASRMVVGEDGKPATEMKMDDGTVSVGSYDLVPILEDFIREHPDFSYQGARAVIAFTGYNGILGYRTAPSYMENETYELDKQEAARVAQCLRDNGWELASHSWGHRNMGEISLEELKVDTDKWENEVESLIGPTDIILFPFGSDIAGWKPYEESNKKFQYLKSVGFRYFCNVDSSRYWVQIGADHFRQGRRNLDGYRMYYDIVEPDPAKKKLSDLFNPDEVFDSDRPTPVPPMSGG